MKKTLRLILILPILLQILSVKSKDPNYISVQGDVTVNGKIKGKKLYLQDIHESIECEQLTAYHTEFKDIELENNAFINKIKVSEIIPQNKNKILNFKGTITFKNDIYDKIQENDEIDQNNQAQEEEHDSSEGNDQSRDGELSIKNKIDKSVEKKLLKQALKVQAKQNKKSNVMLQTKNLQADGVKQWILIESENFNFKNREYMKQNEKNDWKVIINKEKPSLGSSKEKLLIAKSQETINKIFVDLSEHYYIKIEANFFFLSSLWQGQQAYIKVDQQIVWMDSHKWNVQEELTCKQALSTQSEYNWGYPINLIVKHNLKFLEIEIGSSLIEQNQECSQVDVIGFDDFCLYIK